MKREMELVRQILLTMAEHESGLAPQVKIEGYSEEQIGHHVYLMSQAGLIEAADISVRGSASPVAMPISITWTGHEFLDAARSETVWQKAMAQVKVTGGAISFAALQLLLTELTKRALGISQQ